MSAQITYQERLSYELQARAQEQLIEQAMTPAGQRMARFERCFDQARKKIKGGKQVDALHMHEVEALEDAASLDNITPQALVAALKK